MQFHIPIAFQPFLRKSRQDDVETLAPHLRAMDKKEVRTISGHTPLEALRRGFLHSSPAFTLIHPHTKAVLAMGGLGQPGNIIWLLLSKHLLSDRYLRKLFIRHSPRVCAWILRTYAVGGYMGNVTLPENTAVLRWLSWMGATVDEVRKDDMHNRTGLRLARFMFYLPLCEGGVHV